MKTSLRLAPHLKISTTVILIANPKRWTLKQFSQAVNRLLVICKNDIIANDSSISHADAWKSAKEFPVPKLCDVADSKSVNTYDSKRVRAKHHKMQSQEEFSYSALQNLHGCPSSNVILTVAEFLSESASLARKGVSKTAHPAPETRVPLTYGVVGGVMRSDGIRNLPDATIAGALLAVSIMDS